MAKPVKDQKGKRGRVAQQPPISETSSLPLDYVVETVAHVLGGDKDLARRRLLELGREGRIRFGRRDRNAGWFARLFDEPVPVTPEFLKAIEIVGIRPFVLEGAGLVADERNQITKVALRDGTTVETDTGEHARLISGADALRVLDDQFCVACEDLIAEFPTIATLPFFRQASPIAGDVVAPEPDDVTPRVWAAVQMLDVMERESPLKGGTREDLRRKLGDRGVQVFTSNARSCAGLQKKNGGRGILGGDGAELLGLLADSGDPPARQRPRRRNATLGHGPNIRHCRPRQRGLPSIVDRRTGSPAPAAPGSVNLIRIRPLTSVADPLLFQIFGADFCENRYLITYRVNCRARGCNRGSEDERPC